MRLYRVLTFVIFMTPPSALALTAEEWLAKARAIPYERVAEEMLPLLQQYSQHRDERIRAEATRLMSRFAPEDDAVLMLLLELGGDPSPTVRRQALAAIVPLSDRQPLARQFVASRLRVEASAEALTGFADRLAPGVTLSNETMRGYFDTLAARQSRIPEAEARQVDRALILLIRRNSALRRELLARALTPPSMSDRLFRGASGARDSARRLLRLVYSRSVVPEMRVLDSASIVRVPHPNRAPGELPYREAPGESLEIRTLLSEHAAAFRAQPDSSEASLAALVGDYVANLPTPCPRVRLDETAQRLSVTPRVQIGRAHV